MESKGIILAKPADLMHAYYDGEMKKIIMLRIIA